MGFFRKLSPPSPPTVQEEAASEAVARRHLAGWTTEEQAAVESRMAGDPLFADAVRRVEKSSLAVDAYAGTPEFKRYHEQALARARRAHSKSWRLAASFIGFAVVLTAIQLSPWGYRPGQYQTGSGEQRVLELEDRSRIVMDANTRLQTRFTDDVRVVRLLQGQAQFSVGKDPRRPFKVQAGKHTIVALGTDFTVEYVDHEMHVAMLEGQVAVVAGPKQSAPVGVATSAASAKQVKDSSVYLVAGEALSVSREGNATLTPKADLAAATAWRHGKVIFRNEPLGEAIRRVNRYSEIQLEVDDPALERIPFSGVFDTGDVRTFAEAVQTFLPVSLDTSDAEKIRLRVK